MEDIIVEEDFFPPNGEHCPVVLVGILIDRDEVVIRQSILGLGDCISDSDAGICIGMTCTSTLSGVC